ncbi:MAG: L,D-transpeptidase, partial [Clostridiales bacterium]|nr:L,D-transpeptidase [Clostridiales bacterium]
MHRFGWAALVCAAALAALLWLPAGPPTAPASSDAGEAIVYVDLSRLTLTLYIDRRQAGRWPIAGGSPASPSPIGTWHINAKIR